MSKAWQVAVIVDPECEVSIAHNLFSHMPVWTADTSGNSLLIAEARSEGRDCTSFKVAEKHSSTANLLTILDSVELHHPYMTCLTIVGLETTTSLISQLADFGFVPATQSWPDTIAFRRNQVDWTDAPTILLNAADWKTSDDIYDDLFASLGSPSWHGRNFDALNDSIMSGRINTVEVPYRFVVNGITSASPEAQPLAIALVSLISEFELRGCPISISLAP